MNEENLNTNGHSEDESHSGKETAKRITYVSKDLKTIIEFIVKVYTQLGHTTYHSNKAIAVVHGLSPDSIKGHLSSAQQYKLLEIKHGTGYKITELFQRLFLPKSENEKRATVIETLKAPETYQQLFKDYEYNIVPFEGVKNHFIRSFDFRESTAAKAAQVFIDNLKDFQLLDNRGVLTSALNLAYITPEPKSENEDTGKAIEAEVVNEKEQNKQSDVLPGSQQLIKPPPDIDPNIWAAFKRVPIHLTKDKLAFFAYPNDMSEKDIKLVEHNIQGILLRIQLDKDTE